MSTLLGALRRRRDARVLRQNLVEGSDRGLALPRVRQFQLDDAELSAPREEFLRPADIHRREMRIESVLLSKEKPDLQLAIDHPDARPDFIASLEMVLPNELFRNRDGTRRAEPLLNIEIAAVEVRWVECPERTVGEDIDPEDFQIIPGEIRKGDETLDNRRRRRNTRHGRNLRQDRFRKLSSGRCDFQLRLSGYEIDGGCEGPVCAVISNLRCQINRDAKRHTQDIQKSEERMPAQIPQHVPAKDAEILWPHGCSGAHKDTQ